MKGARQTAEDSKIVSLPLVRAKAEPAWGHHENAVRRFLSRVLVDRQEVSDVFQDFCVRMIEQGKPKPEDAYSRGYLLKVALNLVRDRLRRAKARRHDQHVDIDGIELAAAQHTPEDAAHWAQGAHIVKEALKELDPKRSKVFLLYRVKQLTLKEISEETGLPQRTVERYVTHALDHCLNSLQKNGWQR